MKQRVGFARALVVEPEVLFMDEPFSALDVLTAENLRNELLELWINKKMPTSAIFIVTHNIEEAVLLADRIIVLGKNPARIRSDFEVGLPQWRDRKEDRFVELVDYIYKVMTQPEVEHVLRVAPAPAARVRQKYQMLPHARVGGIAGLLELLHDRGGREDLYKLSEELVMDVEDLLPIVEASVLLGLVTLNEGEVAITPQGVRFADADIQARKVIFREAVIKNVMVLQQIENVLKAKADHTIPAEFFHDILDEHFSQDEVERQFDTAMNWGRYAEIFDYDSETERFVLAEPMAEAQAPAPTAKQ
jgi:NitT/TauT family transport system ATP-binding protein